MRTTVSLMLLFGEYSCLKGDKAQRYPAYSFSHANQRQCLFKHSTDKQQLRRALTMIGTAWLIRFVACHIIYFALR